MENLKPVNNNEDELIKLMDSINLILDEHYFNLKLSQKSIIISWEQNKFILRGSKQNLTTQEINKFNKKVAIANNLMNKGLALGTISIEDGYYE